jgi:predicted enzyme related to lactoylglutathione lyase
MSDIGKIVWFEVPVENTDRARTFYGQLMGWQFETFDRADDYFLTYEGGGAIHPANGRKGPLVYFGTDDIEASVARVRELRGSANEPREIPGVGRYAECSDPEGNAFGFYQVVVDSIVAA